MHGGKAACNCSFNPTVEDEWAVAAVLVVIQLWMKIGLYCSCSFSCNPTVGAEGTVAVVYNPTLGAEGTVALVYNPRAGRASPK